MWEIALANNYAFVTLEELPAERRLGVQLTEVAHTALLVF